MFQLDVKILTLKQILNLEGSHKAKVQMAEIQKLIKIFQI